MLRSFPEKKQKRPNRNGVRLSHKYIRKSRCYCNYPRLRLRPSKTPEKFADNQHNVMGSIA